MRKRFHFKPSWKWATPEGSREFDRLLDRSLTFREKLQWLEDAEALSLRFRAGREQAKKRKLRRRA